MNKLLIAVAFTASFTAAHAKAPNWCVTKENVRLPDIKCSEGLHSSSTITYGLTEVKSHSTPGADPSESPDETPVTPPDETPVTPPDDNPDTPPDTDTGCKGKGGGNCGIGKGNGGGNGTHNEGNGKGPGADKEKTDRKGK